MIQVFLFAFFLYFSFFICAYWQSNCAAGCSNTPVCICVSCACVLNTELCSHLLYQIAFSFTRACVRVSVCQTVFILGVKLCKSVSFFRLYVLHLAHDIHSFFVLQDNETCALKCFSLHKTFSWKRIFKNCKFKILKNMNIQKVLVSFVIFSKKRSNSFGLCWLK